MTPSARIAAAIDVLLMIENGRRPAADALRDWGRANRYAGSRDRSAIAAHVYDALRTRASSCWIMGAEDARAMILGSLRQTRGFSLDHVARLFAGERFSPSPLSEQERVRYETGDLANAPDHVAADIPEWLAPSFARSLGAAMIEEGRALARRAPVDLRVNALKCDLPKAEAALAHLEPSATPFAPFGLRIAIAEDGRGPALAAEPAYVKGHVEIQDEASQLAALLTGAAPGEQVLDLCAGAGGKTLALAAMMDNRGQIYATDSDGRRLMPIYERLERAGARNVQVRSPRGAADILGDLAGRCDLVMIDAPCTGVGAWRRNPDAKWRMRPGALEQRIKDQDRVLERAADCVKPGGRIAYVTCSLLREENEDRVADFLGRHQRFSPIDMRAHAQACGLADLPARDGENGLGLLLTPATTGADGFYVCVLSAR